MIPTDCDPLVTYCSDDLKKAQSSDADIVNMISLLETHKARKPKARDISHYGPKLKSLWTKWGMLKIRDGVLFREWSDNLGQIRMRYVIRI